MTVFNYKQLVDTIVSARYKVHDFIFLFFFAFSFVCRHCFLILLLSILLRSEQIFGGKKTLLITDIYLRGGERVKGRDI